MTDTQEAIMVRPHPTALGDALKHAFRLHPAGVAIITAAGPDGPAGLTASSVSSVAVDPAAIMFSVTRSSGTAGALLHADSLLVHLIDAEHVPLAEAFAISGADRFTPGQGWVTLATGEPHLPGARAALRVVPTHVIPVGTSSVVIAEVVEVIPGRFGTPVVYRDRAFHTLATPESPVAASEGTKEAP